jgi:hypothetical protein
VVENRQARVNIDQRLSGKTLSLNERTIQPVAHARGWSWLGGDHQASYGGALVRVQPLQIIVHQGDSVHIIPVVDTEARSLRAIVLPALIVSLVCMLVMFVAQRFAKQ